MGHNVHVCQIDDMFETAKSWSTIAGVFQLMALTVVGFRLPTRQAAGGVCVDPQWYHRRCCLRKRYQELLYRARS